MFFALFVQFKLRARTSLIATLNLTNYSEFGLIVAAIGVQNNWIGSEWLICMANALSLSFAISSLLNIRPHRFYARHRNTLQRFQKQERLKDDSVVDIQGASIMIIGMGRVGTGAYDMMRERHGNTVAASTPTQLPSGTTRRPDGTCSPATRAMPTFGTG